MTDPKISAALSDALAGAADDAMVDVVVELVPEAAPAGPSRAERMAALQSGFASEAAPVEDAIRRAGGEVVGRAWLNQTLLARVPAPAVDAVCRLRQVRRMDRARRLEPEQPE